MFKHLKLKQLICEYTQNYSNLLISLSRKIIEKQAQSCR